MGFSNIVAFCIILGTAATLNVAGITDIETSAQAAEALRPLAGQFSFLLFSLGIIGTGLIAVPVLAGSAAYAVAETFARRYVAEMKPSSARLYEAYLRRELIPVLGARPVAQIRRREMVALLEEVTTRSGKSAAIGTL